MIATTPELFDALASIPVLAGTSLPAKTLIAHEGIVREFAAGQWIVREGEEGHAFFILVTGSVEIIKGADSPHAVSLATLRKGDFFGEMCLLDPTPRAASVRAAEPVKALEIRAATLHHLYQKLPEQYAIVLLNLARDLARRLHRLDDLFAARAY